MAYSSFLTGHAYFRSRFIIDYMCGNIDGLHWNIVQDVVSAVRYVIGDDLTAVQVEKIFPSLFRYMIGDVSSSCMSSEKKNWNDI